MSFLNIFLNYSQPSYIFLFSFTIYKGKEQKDLFITLYPSHEFEWTPGVGDGQGGLACSDSWGCKESDTTERLNWTELTHHLASCEVQYISRMGYKG